MASARDRILDAFEEVLLTEGERAATLDAVASRAGVSKGGLIYHFPSKDLLAHGLCERLTALAAEDAERMRASSEGPARYYIRSSRYLGTPFDRAFVGVARLHQGGVAEAVETIRTIERQWLEILATALHDDDAAHAIKLMGDGLYFQAVYGAGEFAATGGTTPQGDDDLDALLRVVDKIVG
ncbi:MAG: TetR/AcrR family transcriptional regulator [Burkholderiaceae bacterium]|nr:TetR/AcrR family transcriptional regulator [Microbacteriaceae bacterium]